MTRKLINESIEVQEKAKRDEHQLLFGMGCDQLSAGDIGPQTNYQSRSLPVQNSSPIRHNIQGHASALICDDESDLSIDNFDLDRV